MTARELEVLWAVAEHGGNLQAAYVLHITQQTVKNHISEILKKLDSNTALQAYHRLSGGRKVRVVTTTTVSYEEDLE